MKLTFSEITDQKKWDQVLFEASPEALFQTWEWGDVQKKLGVPIWRFGIYQGHELGGIVQIVKTTARRGSFLHVRHGPIFKEISSHFWKEVTTFLKRFAQQEGCVFFRISPLVEQVAELEHQLRALHYQPAAIHAMDAEYCWVLDLQPSADELLKNMRKTTRYEIKRAMNAGAEVVMSTSAADLHYFFDLYDQTSKRQGFVPHHGIAEEFEVFTKKSQAVMFLGKWQHTVVSVAIVLFVGNQAIYHHGASTKSEIPLSYLVQWRAIEEAKKRGKKLYNFWGIAPEDKEHHPWRGITLFKKGFGGDVKSYIHAHDYPVSPLYTITRIIETIRRIRKGY